MQGFQTVDTIEANAKHRTLRRPLLIAAVISLLLLLVGCAIAYVINNMPMIETVFGTNGRTKYAYDTVGGVFEAGGERVELDKDLAKKYLDPNIFPIDKTLSDGDTKLTVLSCLVDRTACTASFYMKMENPPEYEVYNSGRILFKTESIKDVWYVHPRAIGQSDMIGMLMIDEASTSDSELFFVLIFSCEPEATHVELHLGERTEEILVSLPDHTELPEIILENGAIQITPLGMKLSTSVLRQDYDAKHPEREKRETAILFKDGSEYLVHHRNSPNWEDELKGYTYGMALNVSCEDYVFVFNRIIEIDDVVGFRTNDHFYPI